MEKPSDSFLYPLRDSTALLKAGRRVLDFYIPPKSPFDKGGLCQGSRPITYNKKIRWFFHRIFAVPPQGLEPWTLALRVLCSTN